FSGPGAADGERPADRRALDAAAPGLGAPVPAPAVRIEVVGPERAAVRAAPCRGPRFAGGPLSEGRWHALASGAADRDARCLAGYDDEGAAVAGVRVWPAGEGRPGLIEPMGVHRGRGHGTAITVAAVAARRELGSSSALVCT